MKKKEAWYAVIGGIVGAVLTMAAAQFAPHVGRITCTDLEVVDSKGNPRVRLSAHEYGGRVHVLGDGVSAAMLTQKHIAIVSVSDDVNDVNDDYLKASMGISKLGGYVRVSGGGEGYRSRAAMYITPNGGAISAQDKNGNPLRLADLK